MKVVCRYQQYRAARRIVERLRTGKTAEERSGVVWHTQGSGKSLTMVFVARMLRASRDLADFKIVLVNDRIDLEEQLAGTAKLIGGKVNVIESTAAAARAPEHRRLRREHGDGAQVPGARRSDAAVEVARSSWARYGKPPSAPRPSAS